MHFCMEQDTECYAIQLESKFSNIYVLATYREHPQEILSDSQEVRLHYKWSL
jgi:hypothetical protein